MLIGIPNCCTCPTVCCPPGSTVEVLFSGITACDCAAFGGGKINLQDFDLVGPFTLSWITPPYWSATGVGSGTIHFFEDDCGSTEGKPPEEITFDIQLSCTDGIYTLIVGSTYGEVFYGSGAEGVIFSSLAITDCDGERPNTLAYGGQASIVCIPL
jgi:hypothetical protein